MKLYSGEINNPELEVILIKRYADSMKEYDEYCCENYYDFICNAHQECSDCDFSEENMKARHDEVMIRLGRMKAPRASTGRLPAKKDKQYKSTLRQLRGHNEKVL